MIRYFGFVVVTSVIWCGPLLAQKSQAEIDDAVGAAGRWLSLVDEGHYAESWDSASSALKSFVTLDEWVTTSTALGEFLGTLRSRRLVDAEYTANLAGAPPGEYVVVQFVSRFDSTDSIPETVTLKLEHDGTWRVAGWQVRTQLASSRPANDSAAVLEQQGVEAAFDWVTLLDQGLYRESWKVASDTLRASISADDWIGLLTESRQPLGAPVVRVIRERRYTERVPGLPDGDYVIVVFSSDFEDGVSVAELVQLGRQSDGAWKVMGYYIQPGG